MRWTIERLGFDPGDIADNGNRFLVGNGYLGMRGTLAEYGKAQLACVNLAGIYHRVGDGWREPLNAPNPLYARLVRGGVPIALPDTPCTHHRQALDIARGLHLRETQFEGVAIREQRFADMAHVHLLCMRYEATWEGGAPCTLEAGIDADVWDIYGPHYQTITRGDDWLLAETDAGQQVAVAIRPLLEETPGALRYTVCAAIYTSNDCADPLAAAREAASGAEYAARLAAHEAVWADLWARAGITIDGDEEAETALNYSAYHLLSIAPRHAKSLSIAARGLSGQTYKGAIFWDTEMFMLDFYLAVLPEVAKAALRYRIDTLPGALAKAQSYGLRGAFYAWESQEGGYDACSDYNVTDVFTGRPMRTFFKDKQIHITAAVVYGLCKYEDWTGDTSLMAEGGLTVLVEAARFYQSLLTQRVGSDIYELLDVVGPDEYHERVHNNAYTNEMARLCFREAAARLRCLECEAPDAYAALDAALSITVDIPRFEEAATRLKRQLPRTDGVIEQFDGYFQLEDASVEEVRTRLLHPKEYWGGAYGVAAHTQVIKQADVITMLYLLRDQTTPETLRANYDYYEPRTEHGSSLSACMYALVACLLRQPDTAYPLFMKSATADLVGGGKEWAGLVYIGGTHPAAAGGAYMTLLHGFLGLTLHEGTPHISPRLPTGWKRVTLCMEYRGKRIKLVGER